MLKETNIKAELRQLYLLRIPSYRRLLKEVEQLLTADIAQANIKLQWPILKRIKDFESFYAKMSRKATTGDAFKGIHDIAGLRVICLYRSDLEKIETLIKNRFHDVRVDKKSQSIAASQFGYVSDHYIVKLPKGTCVPEFPELGDLDCEIQTRTVLMHGWAAVSHNLEYKKDVDIPSELKKDFYALSALLHLADTQFDMIRKTRQSIRERLRNARTGSLELDREINLDTLFAFLRWKFTDRKASSPHEYSRLVSLLREAGYSKLSELDSQLDLAALAFKSYEEEKPPRDAQVRSYSDVGAVRLSLAIIDHDFRRLAYFGSDSFAEYEKLLQERSRNSSSR
jgi:putative GTP pyrophosphokinase